MSNDDPAQKSQRAPGQCQESLSDADRKSSIDDLPVIQKQGSIPSSEAARNKMPLSRRHDTAAESRLFSVLDCLNLQYVTNTAAIEGVRVRLDAIFPEVHLAVFMDGCFWHGCPIQGTLPKANAEWWQAKLESNRQRDVRIDARLCTAGWTVLRFWKHEDPVLEANAVALAVRSISSEADRPSIEDGAHEPH